MGVGSNPTLSKALTKINNKLVYQSLENKKSSVQASLSVSTSLNPIDHIWFPSSSLYSIRTKKSGKSPIKYSVDNIPAKDSRLMILKEKPKHSLVALTLAYARRSVHLKRTFLSSHGQLTQNSS